MKPNEMELPTSSVLEARKGEGLLIIIQNNNEKSLIISGINESLATLLGYANAELIDCKLETILGKDTAAAIADVLEFEEDAPDFGDVFARIREIKLRRRLGDEIRIECKLSRLLSQGQNACFQMVIPNELERISGTKLKDFLALNLEGRQQIDPATGLPDHQTAKEFLPLLKNYLGDSNIDIVFAVLRLDRHQKSLARYGREACAQLLLHASNCCRTTFRGDDMIFALSDHTLGVVLFDISRESARVVFNRLRWKIRNHRFEFGGKADFTITTCIGFDMLNVEEAAEVFDRCEKAIVALDGNERNALVELNAG